MAFCGACSMVAVGRVMLRNLGEDPSSTALRFLEIGFVSAFACGDCVSSIVSSEFSFCISKSTKRFESSSLSCRRDSVACFLGIADGGSGGGFQHPLHFPSAFTLPSSCTWPHCCSCVMVVSVQAP